MTWEPKATAFLNALNQLVETRGEKERRSRFGSRDVIDKSELLAAFGDWDMASNEIAWGLLESVAAELGISPGALRPEDSLEHSLFLDKPFDDGVEIIFRMVEDDVSKASGTRLQLSTLQELLRAYVAFKRGAQ